VARPARPAGKRPAGKQAAGKTAAAASAHVAKSARKAPSKASVGPAAKRMPSGRRSWDAKLKPDAQPKVVRDPRLGDRLLVPTPMLVAETVAAVPAGQVLTVTELRARLAARFGADRTCPLTAGIFAMVIAGAVADDLARRRPPRWPIWRLVRDDGRLHDRWPLDERWRAAQLRAEGVRVGHNGGWKVLGVPVGR